MFLQLVFRIILLSWPMIARAQESPPFAMPDCPSECGKVTIPFPFGIGNGCYLDDWFAIGCNSSNKPFIKSINLEVLEISVDKGTMLVNHSISKSCESNNSAMPYGNLPKESPFFYSEASNIFTFIGCNKVAYMMTDSILGGCFSLCDAYKIKSESDTSCDGIGCCKSPIPSSLQVFTATMKDINYNDNPTSICNRAFLVDQNSFETNLINPDNVINMTRVPVVLDWGIFNSSFSTFAANRSYYDCAANGSVTYYDYQRTSSCANVEYLNSSSDNFSYANSSILRCKCNPCRVGNAYLPNGCQGVVPHCNSPKTSDGTLIKMGLGFGIGLGCVFLLFGAWWLRIIIIEKRKVIKLKQKFFKQNGGFLLQQQLASNGHADNSKLFSSKELDKATDHFDVNRILGQGGQGTVYKGLLSNGRIVAIKKPKVVDEGKVHEFINEVVILSQINHRNVVKLFGCCLETEAPLLVYEFIPNGTLFQYLHHQTEELSLTWGMRLRIATEVAEALSYMHLAASLPIYHRDIKSTNILLDEKYRAKVVDLGTSKSFSIDQTHVTTNVQGTFGYLDPEFFQSGQFSDKSDVYSFGVVLVELLTREKPISSTRSEESRNLTAYFIISMENNCLHNIIDAQVLKEGKKEDIMAVANLAIRCLNPNGKKRPTMKEVTMELEGIQASKKDDGMLQTYQEIEFEKTEVFETWDAGSSSTFTLEHVGSSI